MRLDWCLVVVGLVLGGLWAKFAISEEKKRFPDPLQDHPRNPAALIPYDQSHLHASTVYTKLQFNDLGSESQIDDRLPPQDSSGNEVGAIQVTHLSLQVPLGFGLNFGLSASMPSEFMRVHVLSGEERHYLRNSERSLRPEIYTALGIQLGSHWSLGLGVYHTLKATGDVQIAVADEIRGRALIDVKPVQIPFAGVRYQRIFGMHQLAIEMFYREASDTKASFDTEVSVSTPSLTIPTKAGANLALFYEPAVYRGGLTYQFENLGFFVGYERIKWSSYQSPYFKVESEVAGPPEFDPIEFQDSASLKVGIAQSSPLWGPHAATLKVGYEVHTAALKSDSKNLTLVDLPHRVYRLGGEIHLGRLTEESPVNIEVGVSRLEMTSRDYDLENGEAITAGGYAVSYSGGFSVLL